MITASEILDLYRQFKLKIALAESCTGGLIAASLTDIPNSSDVLERGFVTYSNEAKMELLGVPEEIIANFGAVSSETAEAMAKGCLYHSRADVALSVTGIAGPGGGSPLKPVGLVYFGLAWRDEEVKTIKHLFTGNRAEIRKGATASAFELLKDALDYLLAI